MSLNDIKHASDAVRVIKSLEANPKARVGSQDVKLLKAGLRTLSAYIERHGGADCRLALNYNGLVWLRGNIEDVAALMRNFEGIESEADSLKRQLIKDRLSDRIETIKLNNRTADPEMEYRETLSLAAKKIAELTDLKAIEKEFNNRHPTEKFPRASFLCGSSNTHVRVLFDDWGSPSVAEKKHAADGKNFDLASLKRGAEIAGEEIQSILSQVLSEACVVAEKEYRDILSARK